MLNTPEEIARFKGFMSAGGLKEAENLTRGKAIKVSCESLIGVYSGCVSPDIEDYQGASALVSSIQALNDSLSGAVSTLGQWNEHLVVITDPTDLQQVAMGVEIKRKLDAVANDSPAASILPITSKTELLALEASLNAVSGISGAVVALMETINAAIAPPATDSGSGSGDAAGAAATTTPPPKLSNELANQASQLNVRFSPLVSEVVRAVGVIERMTIDSKTERSIALDYFSKAVAYTICNNQREIIAIKDATLEVFPM